MIAPMNGTPAPREDKALELAKAFMSRLGSAELSGLWGEVRVSVNFEGGRINHVRWVQEETQLIR